MVYQEQVMQVAQVLAGYSLGGADLLRRAMGKKKPEEMAKQKEIFVAGAEKKGIASDKAGEIFDQMAHFAGYGFNKSHSAAYAVLTFQTAYLKAIHPREFYAALMTNDADNTDKVVRYIQDARNRGIRVLPPDVNASGQSFSVVADGIRFGLGAVKGAGTGAVEAVLEARASRPFTSLFDFCERVDPRRCGRRVIEALIRCGAFDSVFPEYRVGETAALARVGRWRSRMWASLDAAIDRGQRAQADAAAGQSNLFDMFGGGAPVLAEPTYADSEGWDDKAVLNAEKETIGFYVSGHPLDRYAEEISQLSDTTTAGIEQVADRAEVRVAGVVAALSERPLKSGEGRMALATLEDTTGSLEMVVYAKLYGEIEALLKGDAPLLVRGRVRVDQSGDDFKRTLVCSEVDRLSDVRERKVTVARVEVDSEEVSPELVTRLSQLLGRHPGRCAVSILVRYPRGEAEVKLPLAMGVACSDALVSEVSMLLGRPAVRFR
jgi:DNA polymerase-3 subunit alpha